MGSKTGRNIECGKTYWYDCTDGVFGGKILHPELPKKYRWSIHTKTTYCKNMRLDVSKQRLTFPISSPDLSLTISRLRMDPRVYVHMKHTGETLEKDKDL